MRFWRNWTLLLLLAFSLRVSAGDPAAWNDRGIRYYESGEYDLAIHCFTRAMDERPEDGTIRFNLASSHASRAVDLVEEGERESSNLPALESAVHAVNLEEDHAYFRRVLGFVHQDDGRYREAIEAYRIADQLEPDDPATLALLGDAAYRLDVKEDALAYWGRSLDIDPSQAVLQERVERTERELRVESGFRTVRREPFRVRYDPSIEGASREADRVIDMLENARREVRSVLGDATERPVPVVLYTPEKYNTYMGSHDWTRGVYDGKIRIPFGEGGMGDQTLQSVTTHEYVHAVVYEMTEDLCPAWLNEGLAQVLAEEWNSSADKIAGAMIGAREQIPLSRLDRSFLKLPPDEVEQAYIESYLVVTYMLDRYTRNHLRRLIRALASGTETSRAVRDIYHVSTDELLRKAINHYQTSG